MKMSKTIPVSGDVSPEAATAIIDVLLLSIIRAHPREGAEATDYKRLNAAKTALFGIDGPRGPAVHDDLPELVHMAEAYMRERGAHSLGENYLPEWPDENGAFYTPPTCLARAAMRARKAADPSYQPHNDEEKVRNLQKKFSRNIGEWQKLAIGGGDLAESVFQSKLRELAELLAPLGVNIAAPVETLRDSISAN
jgi:hypothetical protein